MGKRSKFKKDYASSTSNVSGRGVWSGRGIGIPSLGAHDGSSDGSKYLGRPRRPPYQGDQGSPSQSADSTLSSYMARVNKGEFPDYEFVMFPEQDDDLDDSYNEEEIIQRSSKLPVSSMWANENMKFNESTIVKNSKYSVTKLFEQPDFESLQADRGSENLKDILGDAFMALADSLTGDISGVALAIPAIIKNLLELNSSSNNAEELLEQFSSLPSDDIAVELDNIQHNIIRDLIDFIQRIVEALPLPIIPEEWASFGGGMMTEIMISQMIESAAEAGTASIAEVYSDFIEKVPGPVRFVLSLSAGGPFIGGVLSRAIESAGKIHKAVREYRDQTHLQSAAAYVKPAVSNQISATSNQAKEEIMKRIKQGDMDFFFGAGPPDPIAEAKEILSESIYPDAPSFHEPYPTGFEYRSVPSIVHKSDDEESFEVLDDYDNYSVAYKADGGNIAYQRKNKIEETALRRVIRRKIIKIIQESKKKRNRK